MEKEVTKIDKDREEITRNISYKLQFINSARVMASSLLNLVDNLSEGIHKIKCKFGHDDKNLKLAELNINISTVFFEYTNFRDNLIEYKCLCCSKNYQNKFDETLEKQIFNTYKFSNHDNNQFILLLQKVVCPYEYMDIYEKFNEASLPGKKIFTVT